MGKEIERKFLIDEEKWQPTSTPYIITQVRVRTSNINDTKLSWITIKSRVIGISRNEFEYEIPYLDALQIITMCNKVIIKERCEFNYFGNKWEIDVFKGDNVGLIVAEIELKSEYQDFILPPWIKKEVTHDPLYYNSNLINHPYKNWL